MAIIAESRSTSETGSRPPAESRPITRQDAELAEIAGQPGADREDRQTPELLPGWQPPAESRPTTRQEASKPGRQPSAESSPTRQDAGKLAEIAVQPESIIPESHSVMVDRYAEILVTHAVSLRPGQDLLISGPAPLHDFALRVGEAAYHIGARSVHYRFPDPKEIAQILRVGSPEQITIYHEGIHEFYAEIIKRRAASISLVQNMRASPLMEEVKQRHSENFHFFIHGMSKLSLHFFDQHLRLRRFPHANAPVATDKWADEVFPDSPTPIESLWQVISRAVDGFRDRAEVLESRSDALNSLEIRELHISGGGNDFRISIPERANWHHATLETASGQASCSNFPSDEIFTVPDCRFTEGIMVASKPLRIYNHSMIEGLCLEFRDGRVVNVQSDSGKEAFRSWIASDSGASLVGEIGLVGNDAPLYGIDRYFDFPQFDENTASHIALGQGLSFTLRGADRLSNEDLTTLGCNSSAIHTDICFGSPDVSIVATKTNRGEVVLLDGDAWDEV